MCLSGLCSKPAILAFTALGGSLIRQTEALNANEPPVVSTIVLGFLPGERGFLLQAT